MDLFDLHNDEYLNSLKVGERVIEIGHSCMRGLTGVTYMSQNHGMCVKWEDGMGTGVTHGTRRIIDVLNEIERLKKSN